VARTYRATAMTLRLLQICSQSFNAPAMRITFNDR
jgi:hypothetical protein